MSRDGFVKMLSGAATAMARANSAKQGCITLGNLIALLQAVKDQSLPVRIGGLYVGGAGSYRGYYERLAFSASNEPKTVGELAADCRRYIGAMFHGYKGGEFTMTQDTMIHAAEYGDCGPMIVGIDVGDNSVTMRTQEEQFDD